MICRLLDKPLVCHVINGFPTPIDWPIFAMRWGNLAMGQGHNATTVKKPTVVPTVVGYFLGKTRAYTKATTPQRQIAHIYMYTCAPAHMRGYMPLWALWRCAFLYLFDNQEKYRTTGHNTAHNAQFQTVVGLPKLLENLNKGGF